MSWFTSAEHQPFAFERSDDAAVLLLHGFMGSPAELRPLGRALAEAGIGAHGIALPGFGPDIARLSAVSKADWIEAGLAAWRELAARYRRVSLLGFSMGGALALHLATSAERPPDQLILLAPLSRLHDPRSRLLPIAKHFVTALRPFAQANFDEPETRAFFSENMPGVDLDDPAAREAFRREAVLPLKTLDAMRSLATGTTRLALRLRMPVVILQGIEDDVVRRHDTRLLAEHFAGPLLLREVRAGHQLVRDSGPAWPQVRAMVVAAARGEEAGTC
jgi:carboxylesterase